jgi:hypothetical protein
MSGKEKARGARVKIVTKIDCDERHCGECDEFCAGIDHCNMFDRGLRRTGRGVLRCKQCMEAEQEYKKLDALKKCYNCVSGPFHMCKTWCVRSGWNWYTDDLWGEK